MWRPQPTAGWPGLVRLWQRGDLGGLLLAILFTALVNLALLTTFIWPELLPALYRWLTWGVVLGLWGWGVYRDWASRRLGGGAGGAPPAAAGQADLFVQAQRHYLRGQWDETQQLVRELLQRNAYDLEARLLWATLLRHSGRPRLAQRQLRRLERFEAASRWAWEIQREWQSLRAPAAAPAALDDPPGPGELDKPPADGSSEGAEGEEPNSRPSGSNEGVGAEWPPPDRPAADRTCHLRRAA